VWSFAFDLDSEPDFGDPLGQVAAFCGVHCEFHPRLLSRNAFNRSQDGGTVSSLTLPDQLGRKIEVAVIFLTTPNSAKIDLH
jgi:hypothetical protein